MPFGKEENTSIFTMKMSWTGTLGLVIGILAINQSLNNHHKNANYLINSMHTHTQYFLPIFIIVYLYRGKQSYLQKWRAHYMW